jgi:DAK2 domain fusion protein YloV
VPDPSLVRLRAVVAGALASLESCRAEVNDLNVFPVADGDTGDNMALTLRAVLAELDRLAHDEGRLLDEIGCEEIVSSVARAALLGARGNSGIILSQLIRGAAEELISRPGELVDPLLVAAAMARAADRAYGSVREPAEGTMLTVMREMATWVASDLAHRPAVRLGAETASETQDAVIADVLAGALEAGQASLRRGPDLLPALREAGVVDAGGYGVVLVFAGIVAALRGEEQPAGRRTGPSSGAGASPVPVARQPAPRVTRPEHASSTFRFCTNFVVTGRELQPTAWSAPLEALGDSVLVVGDAATLKVHVHTDEPERATALFAGVGVLSHLDVADMRAQVGERARRLAAWRCDALAVVAGSGLRALFASLGLHALDAARNPSTMELLAALHQLEGEEVVLLPNSPNVVLAAERAAELSEKVVHVVATRSPQAGLAAAVAFEPTRDAASNARAMADALTHVRTGGVAPAARADGRGRFPAGAAVGYVEEALMAWGDPEATLREVLACLADGAELLTCLAGAGAPLDDDRVRALTPGDVELEVRAGGQPSWWWLLAAE